MFSKLLNLRVASTTRTSPVVLHRGICRIGVLCHKWALISSFLPVFCQPLLAVWINLWLASVLANKPHYVLPFAALWSLDTNQQLTKMSWVERTVWVVISREYWPSCEAPHLITLRCLKYSRIAFWTNSTCLRRQLKSNRLFHRQSRVSNS